MATISKLILPVKTGGVIQNIEFDLPSSSPESLGFGYGVCSTAYITPSKAVSITGYTLTRNGIVSVTFENAVPSSAALNVNNEGAKPIYHRGAAIMNNVIFAGDTATFIYDGTKYNLIALDRTPTVSNKTVTL